jgi:hypothetical protein
MAFHVLDMFYAMLAFLAAEIIELFILKVAGGVRNFSSIASVVFRC